MNMNERLRNLLLSMAANDAQVREELAEAGELFDGYAPKMEKVHLENAAELEKLIEENGEWLGKSLVGKDGAEAAWLIVQHAISLPEFCRKCLKLIEEAVEKGEAEAWQAAYLQDRINHFEGKPQKYGTNFNWNEEGKMQVWTLLDEEKVNEYRAEVGLEPLKNLIWEDKETAEHRPKDWRKWREEFQAWTRKVGWRH